MPYRQIGGGGGFLRVVSPAQLDASDAANLAELSRRNRPQLPDDLGAYVRRRWEAFRNHRNSGQNPLNDRLLRAQRMFEGQYDPTKLAEIRKFGGSEVYSRMVAVKCRGATSLLRDVYMGPDRPWDIEPVADPPVPAGIMTSIAQTLAAEAAGLHQAGQPIDPDQVHMRYVNLVRAAQQTARRNAMVQADAAADKIDDMLVSGGFYDALAEFLVDISLFPFACVKGPVVRMVPKLVWQNRQPTMQVTPQMFWERVDPFNLYWTPGAAYFEDAEVIERKKLTRADLNDCLGLPGYNEEAVRGALEDYGKGLRDWLDAPDTEAALNSGKESPSMNQSHMIDGIEFHGNVQGRMLVDQGVDVPDLDRDYMVQTWVVGRHTIKTQITPSPRHRHPYYLTSFEKVPGTVSGHGLPDILEDLQEVANATLRSLVNNMSIASGPQVVINTELLDPTTNEDTLYPWKRWKTVSDPLGNQREPVHFFQPSSNAQELMGIYTSISGLSDDISAIPRYITGESLKGGAGRTASGLSMLMGNATKVLQTVASNVDIDIIRGVLQSLYDMIMLTDQTGLLTGEEQVKVNGVVVAMQKETEQQKQLQFLQITANPVDTEIIGPVGRGRVLRALSQNLGLPDDVVPDDQALISKQQAQQQMQAAMLKAQASGALPVGQPGKPGGPPGGPPGPGGPGGPPGGGLPGLGPAPGAAAAAQGNQAPRPGPPSFQDIAPQVNTVTQ
jgi:hypothetical protein